MSASNITLTHNPRIPTNIPSDDDDPTSSSGSSDSESEESSDEEDDDTHHEASNQGAYSTEGPSIPSVTGRPKPRIYKPKGNSDLMTRLSAFLPQMKSANEELEKSIAEGKREDLVLDSAVDGKDYIEMNLGLGVLEEKRDGDDSSGAADTNLHSKGTENMTNGHNGEQDSNIMDQLMGGKNDDEDMEKPSIEEVKQ